MKRTLAKILVIAICLTFLIPLTALAGTKNITAVTNPDRMVEPFGTAYSSLSLPTEVSVTLDDGTKDTVPVTWAQGIYDGNTSGTYTLTGTLGAKDGISNMKNLSPYLYVAVSKDISSSFTYSNPFTYPNYIDKGNGFRDPFILRVGNAYYLTGTRSDYGVGSPGISLYKSYDLKNWQHVCDPVLKPNAADNKWYNYAFWAPEIFEHNGKFYCTVNCSRKTNPQIQEVALLEADSIDGPYTMVTKDDSLIAGNDADIYQDDDGRTYMFISNIDCFEIDLNTGRRVGDVHECIRPSTTNNDCFYTAKYTGCEGPYCVKRNGTYFLFFSTWARGYETGYATSKSILGPWTINDNPVYGSIDTAKCQSEGLSYDPTYYDNNFRETGHNSVFIGPDGNDWIAAHTYKVGSGLVQMSIDPLVYDGDSIYVKDGTKEVHGPTMGTKTISTANQPAVTITKALDTYLYFNLGENPTLPSKEDVRLSNGWRESYPVTWDNTISTSSAGDAVVNGTVTANGKTYSCKAYVSVTSGTNDVTSLSDSKTSRVELENKVLSDGVTTNTAISGYSGDGYTDNWTAQYALASFKVNSPVKGKTNLSIGYANSNSDSRTLSLYVNGDKQVTLTFPANAGTWGTTAATVDLPAGYSTVTIKYDSADTGAVQLDYVDFSAIAADPVPSSSEPASSTVSSSSAPVSSAPASSTPASSAPASSAPVSSAPVSSAPAASAPASSVPASASSAAVMSSSSAAAVSDSAVAAGQTGSADGTTYQAASTAAQAAAAGTASSKTESPYTGDSSSAAAFAVLLGGAAVAGILLRKKTGR